MARSAPIAKAWRKVSDASVAGTMGPWEPKRGDSPPCRGPQKQPPTQKYVLSSALLQKKRNVLKA